MILYKKKETRKFLHYKYTALADFLLLIITKTEEETFPDRYIKPCLEVWFSLFKVVFLRAFVCDVFNKRKFLCLLMQRKHPDSYV